ncbi:MAG: sugar phosphate isomerase/epimerase family protein [Bacteroidota bacterium]
MYKRAVITDEISQDFARAVEVAREFGLEGVELRSAWDKNPHELGKEERRRIRDLAGRAGLSIPCVAGPIFKCQLYDERDYQEHLTVLERCLDVAHELGAGLVRGFTFWDDGDFERALPWIAERLAAIGPTLRAAKVKMVLESDPATAANSHQKLSRVLAMTASDEIKALWDPGNNLYVSGATRPFPEGYELLRPYLAHIHVKDIRRQAGAAEPEACCLGQGEVGYARVFPRLVADGYDGWLSLETHYRKRGPISDELLALPKGSAFSLGGEEATRECLAAWNGMLDR